MGREGSVLLVNGRQNRPSRCKRAVSSLAADQCNAPTLPSRRGRRSRRTASAVTRFARETIAQVPDLLLVPGERADVVFVARKSRDRVSVDVLPYDRGAGPGPTMHLMV